MQDKTRSPLVDEQTISQLIVFRAGNEEFGVPIDEVREIIKIGDITPIPNSPNFIKGIVNVRGEIVTAIDVKKRFGLKDKLDVEAKHIVVTKQEDNLFGLMVDEVIEVLRVNKNIVKPPPALVASINKKYVNGVVSHEGRLIILIDLTLILSQEEMMHIADKLKHKKSHNKVKRQNEQSNEKPDNNLNNG